MLRRPHDYPACRDDGFEVALDAFPQLRSNVRLLPVHGLAHLASAFQISTKLTKVGFQSHLHLAT